MVQAQLIANEGCLSTLNYDWTTHCLQICVQIQYNVCTVSEL